MRLYRRGALTAGEEFVAATLGLAVGAAAYYVARLWLRREPIRTEQGSTGSTSTGRTPAERDTDADALP